MNREKNIIIYSQRLAGMLMEKGFRLVGVQRNNNDTRKYIFIFKNNGEIFEYIKQYSNK